MSCYSSAGRERLTLSAAGTTVSSYNRVHMSCYSSAGREILTLSAAGTSVSSYNRVYMSCYSSAGRLDLHYQLQGLLCHPTIEYTCHVIVEQVGND